MLGSGLSVGVVAAGMQHDWARAGTSRQESELVAAGTDSVVHRQASQAAADQATAGTLPGTSTGGTPSQAGTLGGSSRPSRTAVVPAPAPAKARSKAPASTTTKTS